MGPALSSKESLPGHWETACPRGIFLGVRLFVPLAGFWAILILNLAGYWSTIPQYSFGWLVPALTILLIVARWKTRPVQGVPLHSGIVLVLIAFIAFMVLPAWVLEQPNSDWRLVSWFLAVEVLILTFGLIYLEFGIGTLLHLAPPLLFFLTCVPWPFDLEWPVIQGLTRFVVGMSIDILNLIGIGAIQHGNLIEVSNGTLDVTEACSGIRSLQSSFMVSVFLGEFYRLNIFKRCGLIALGMVAAVVCNITRACFLVYLAARNGMESTANWHDSAGVTILLICFVCVWIAAFALSGSEADAVGTPAAIMKPRVSWRLSSGILLWFLIVLVATEAWYRHHESKPLITWDFHWPKELPGFQEHPVSAFALDLLHFDTGRFAQWQAADGTGRAAFFLKWKPGVSRSRIPSRSHRPEICLSANGYILRSDLGMTKLVAGNIDIPFEHYVFEADNVPVNVFFCVWQDHPRAGAGDVDLYWSRYAGFMFALHGQRSISQQVLEYAIFGSLSPEQAAMKFRAELGALIVK